MAEDMERQEDSRFDCRKSLDDEQGSNGHNNHMLVSYKYCQENEELSVPQNVQHLIVLHPTKSVPSKLCYLFEHLQQIQLPAGLQQIGEKAFCGCRSLQEVALPLPIKSIGQLAFEGCSSLVMVTSQITNGETRVEQEMKGLQPRSTGRSVTSRYKALRKMVFNASSASNKIDDAIWYQAFKGCKSLQEFVVPTNVKAIKEGAFEDCQSLLEIDLPGDLVQIQFSAFKHCSSLQRIKIPSTVELLGSYLFLRCTALVEVTLAEGLKRIGNFAFAYCTSLEKIRLPSTVKMIEKGAFSFCDSLANAELRDAEAEIHSKVFQDCSSLQRMTLPPLNKMLHSDTFCNCRHLVEIKFSEGLVTIGHSALRNCQSLRSVAFPKSLKRVHVYAMAGCTNLVSVEIPKGTKAKFIQHAFQDCESLANVVIPASMVKLLSDSDGNFFSGCMLLQLQYACNIHSRTRSTIFERLEHRFQNFPVHELCYYASSTTKEELEKEVQKSNQTQNDWKHVDMKNIRDVMGMTPFHVLLSASTRRLDLLEVLLDTYPATLLFAKDENGMSAVNYLTSNWTVDARQMMRKCLQKSVLYPFQNWGLATWKKTMEDGVDSVCAVDCRDGNHELRLESQLLRLVADFSMYKKLEITSLLEQWLWKMALSSTEKEIGDEEDVKRSICRAKCGASFIIPIVKTFLDDTTWGKGF